MPTKSERINPFSGQLSFLVNLGDDYMLMVMYQSLFRAIIFSRNSEKHGRDCSCINPFSGQLSFLEKSRGKEMKSKNGINPFSGQLSFLGRSNYVPNI